MLFVPDSHLRRVLIVGNIPTILSYRFTKTEVVVLFPRQSRRTILQFSIQFRISLLNEIYCYRLKCNLHFRNNTIFGHTQLYFILIIWKCSLPIFSSNWIDISSKELITFPHKLRYWLRWDSSSIFDKWLIGTRRSWFYRCRFTRPVHYTIQINEHMRVTCLLFAPTKSY